MEAVKSAMNGYLNSRNVYIVMSVVIVLGMGVYSYFRVTEMLAIRGALAENENIISEIDQSAGVEKKSYEEKLAILEKDYANFRLKMLSILPPGEQITNLTRFFDQFFNQFHTRTSPLVAESIRYGTSREVPGGSYAVMPFTMNIESSIDNFFTFLRFIEESGSLENGVRLMDIESVQLNFDPGAQVQETDTINFTVHLNAYHRI